MVERYCSVSVLISGGWLLTWAGALGLYQGVGKKTQDRMWSRKQEAKVQPGTEHSPACWLRSQFPQSSSDQLGQGFVLPHGRWAFWLLKQEMLHGTTPGAILRANSLFPSIRFQVVVNCKLSIYTRGSLSCSVVKVTARALSCMLSKPIFKAYTIPWIEWFSSHLPLLNAK